MRVNTDSTLVVHDKVNCMMAPCTATVLYFTVYLHYDRQTCSSRINDFLSKYFISIHSFVSLKIQFDFVILSCFYVMLMQDKKKT